MSNSRHWVYVSLLLASTLATPAAAQAPDSEMMPNSESSSAVTLASDTTDSSEVVREAKALRKEVQVQVDEVKIAPKELPDTVAESAVSVSSRESLASVDRKFETNSDATTAVGAIAKPDTSSQTAQAEPAISPHEPVSPGWDDLQETDTSSMGQVTNVTQLQDVQPTDWAYEALRSLVERYGCIAGYPDGTFRGNRALTRYEFAAGLSACLQQIERLIANRGDLASQDDLKTLQRLVDEFSSELVILKTRVDTLEGRTAFLEDHQFSTTTKLFGQVVMGVQGRTDNEAPFFLGFKVRDPETNINVITNTQLSLLTQFNRRSILLTGIQAGSGFTGGLNPSFTRLGYEGATFPDNSLVLSDLTYRHLIGNKFAFIVGTTGVNPVNVFRGANRVESVGFGPISAFAQRNPIINIGGNGGGAGFDWQISPRISLQAVYSADLTDDPSNGGLFGGNRGRTTAGVQLALAPINRIDIALNYINSYAPGGRFDSGTLGTGIGDDLLTVNAPLKTDAFGGTISWRITRGFTIGGWAGYTNSWIPGRSGNVETINWMAFLNFPDLLGRGNLGGIYVGQPPKIMSSNLPVGFNIPDLLATGNGNPGEQPGTATHVEAFYRFRVTDNISITPGVVVVFQPGHNPESDTVTIGAVRTTFTF
ncbi:MAG TPA: iron uptake porin [Waterburya sp.]